MPTTATVAILAVALSMLAACGARAVTPSSDDTGIALTSHDGSTRDVIPTPSGSCWPPCFERVLARCPSLGSCLDDSSDPQHETLCFQNGTRVVDTPPDARSTAAASVFTPSGDLCFAFDVTETSPSDRWTFRDATGTAFATDVDDPADPTRLIMTCDGMDWSVDFTSAACADFSSSTCVPGRCPVH